MVLALIGKIGAATGFALVYQYSAELFPTVVRNAGMGSCSCMARIGGVIAPFVADLVNMVLSVFAILLMLCICASTYSFLALSESMRAIPILQSQCVRSFVHFAMSYLLQYDNMTGKGFTRILAGIFP